MDRVLEKFGIELDDLLGPAGALESRLVRSQLPAEAGRRAGAPSRGARNGLWRARARRHARSIRRWPGRCRAPGTRRSSGTQDVEKKLVQHLKRRQETELGQIARARTAVQPGGKPQERVLTVAPFLARYGPALVTDLRGGDRGDGMPAPLKGRRRRS